MATWESNPSVPHTGGTFTFPKNEGTTEKVYTITYTDDDGCTAQTTYTVQTGSTCQPCPACGTEWKVGNPSTELEPRAFDTYNINDYGLNQINFRVFYNDVINYDLHSSDFEVLFYELNGTQRTLVTSTTAFYNVTIDEPQGEHDIYKLIFYSNLCGYNKSQKFIIAINHKVKDGCPSCSMTNEISCNINEGGGVSLSNIKVYSGNENTEITSEVVGAIIEFAAYSKNTGCTTTKIYNKTGGAIQGSSEPYKIGIFTNAVINSSDTSHFKEYMYMANGNKIVNRQTGEEPATIRPLVISGLANFPFSNYNPTDSYVFAYPGYPQGNNYIKVFIKRT